jgi:type III pantothenate kinase
LPQRILVISVGNTSLFGGVFTGDDLSLHFRVPTAELPALKRQIPDRIDRAIVCSVVPALTPDVMRFIRRSWNLDAEQLTFQSRHGLAIGYREPQQLGADRIAAAVGARARFPGKNVIVVDCGTATTVTVLRADGRLAGGAILPGLALWSEMLAQRTAQLPRISVEQPRRATGRSTEEGIASGLFFGHLGAIRELVTRMRVEIFGRAACVVVATGGESPRFAGENLFTVIEPTLILQGLHAFALRLGRS